MGNKVQKQKPLKLQDLASGSVENIDKKEKEKERATEKEREKREGEREKREQEGRRAAEALMHGLRKLKLKPNHDSSPRIPVRCRTKFCHTSKICNPKSGRCVSRTGKIGKTLIPNCPRGEYLKKPVKNFDGSVRYCKLRRKRVSKRVGKRVSKRVSKRVGKRVNKTDTKSNLSRIKASTVKKLYQMTYDSIRIVQANNLKIWAEGGTLLGAIRNKGIIPWDDDVDLGLLAKDKGKFESLRPAFKKCGYKLLKVWFGYKIFPLRAKLIKGHKWGYPFVDFFFYDKMAKKGGGYAFKLSPVAVRKSWPESYYTSRELFPLKLEPFGDFLIPVCNKAKSFLTRQYGSDWATHGYQEYDHAKEKEVKKVKVRLSQADLQPAKPTSVENRTCVGRATATTDISIKSMLRKSHGKCKREKKCDIKLADSTFPVYVINCEVHAKRLKKFRKYASGAKLSSCREVCVNGKAFTEDFLCDLKKRKMLSTKADISPIEVAICFSHINVWRRFYDTCAPYALIIEDDAQVAKNFKTLLEGTLSELKDAGENFSILYLWNGNWGKTLKQAEKVLDVKIRSKRVEVIEETSEDFNPGAVAYVLTRGFTKRLLSKVFPISIPIDIYMADTALGSKKYARENPPLSIKMTYNKSKKCYLSPFFVGTKWICGGDQGTGQSTQDYSEVVSDILQDCKRR